MHKGRSYPYDWYFWGTECFFWPGFVPWQLRVTNFPGVGYPWDQLSHISVACSIPAIGVPDRTQVYWEWPMGGVGGLIRVRVSVEKEMIYGRDWAVWNADAYDIAFNHTTVWLFQGHPQYTFLAPGQHWWTVHDPHAGATGPFLGFRPARWNEITVQPHQ